MKTKIVKSGIYYDAEITTDRSGRMSIVISDNIKRETIADIELPAKTGEFKDAFKSTIKISSNIEITKL